MFLETARSSKERPLKIGISNDIGWGCTIRVGQMMLAHSLLRHVLHEYNILGDLVNHMPTYTRVLTLMNDNADGAPGAFSI